MTLMQMIFGLVCAGIDSDICFLPASNLIWILAIAIAGLLAHLCLTRALTQAPATIVAPIDFLRLPVIVVVGFCVFGETLDQFLPYGVILIFLGKYANIIAENGSAWAKRNYSKLSQISYF